MYWLGMLGTRFFHLLCTKGGAKKLQKFKVFVGIEKDGDVASNLEFGVFFGRKSADSSHRQLSIFNLYEFLIE